MVEPGQTVRIHYISRLEDGTIFDESHAEGEPLELVVGNKKYLPAMEMALLDMEPGQKKTLLLNPKDAYGDYDKSLVQQVPLANLPGSENLHKGDRFGMQIAGELVEAGVAEIDDNYIWLDLNHALAGKPIRIDIELVEVVHESAIDREKHPAGCACGCDKLKEAIGKKPNNAAATA